MLASVVTAAASLTFAIAGPTDPPPTNLDELERIAETAFTAKAQAEHGEVRDVACAVRVVDAESGIAFCYGIIPDPNDPEASAIAVDVASVSVTDGYDSDDDPLIVFVHPDSSPQNDQSTPDGVRRAAEEYLLSYDFETAMDRGRPENPRCDTPDEVAEGETFRCRVDLVLSADAVLTAEVIVRITDDTGSILVTGADVL